MPKATDWVQFFYLNLAFIIQILVIYFYSQINNWKQNWASYKCNPLYMPLSNNSEKDFIECVQNIQSEYMNTLLNPVNTVIKNLENMGNEYSGNITNITRVINNTRDFISIIVKNIFGIFLNVSVEMIRITQSIKDIFTKLLAMFVTMTYIMDGSVKTMQSSANISIGHCFHPDTKIYLKNGSIVKMKNINLGDILESGSKIHSLMKVLRESSDCYYQIYDNIHKENIYVTGSHYIFFNDKFIQVKDYPYAIKTNSIESDYFVCLITDDHKIKIGDLIFWDWEDWREMKIL